MSESQRLTKYRGISLEIILLLVLPTLVFTFGLLPPLWRYLMMEAALAVVVVLVVKRRISLQRLGLRLDNFRQSARLLLPGTLAVCFVAVVAYFLGFGTALTPPHVWWNGGFFLYYMLVAVLSQQFAFQSYGTDRLRQLGLAPWLIASLIAVLFSLLHSHHVSGQLWLATFAVGLFWTISYLKQPNLLAVSLSHGTIGIVTIMLGFV